MAMRRSLDGNPVIVEALQRFLSDPDSKMGYDPAADYLWVGESADDPERHTYTVEAEEWGSFLKAVAGVCYLQDAFG